MAKGTDREIELFHIHASELGIGVVTEWLIKVLPQADFNTEINDILTWQQLYNETEHDDCHVDLTEEQQEALSK